MTRVSRLCAALLTGLATVCGALADNAWAQFSRSGELYFIQGIPGQNVIRPPQFPVNISIALQPGGVETTFYTNVNFREWRGPLQVTEGSYTVTFTEAQPPDPTVPALKLSATVSLRAGQNQTVVSCLTGAGLPQLPVYSNDVSKLSRGSSRLTVRHTAFAGPIDLSIESLLGQPGWSANNLANSAQSPVTTLMTGPYTANVRAAGTPNALIGPTNVTLKSRNAHFIYAVGDPTNGTFGLVQHGFPVTLLLQPQ